MVRGALPDDHMIQLKVVTGTLNSQKLQDEILESGVRPPLDWLDGQNMVLRNDIARPHCTRIIEEYKNQQIGHWLDMVYLPTRGNFEDHIFLKAQCLARILQHVSPLTMAALSCNSLLHTLPYKIFDN